jgi:hypothetical protein
MGGGNLKDFVSKLIQSIPRLHRVPEKEYLVEVGRGLPCEESLLRQEVAAMLEPRLPNERSFQHFHSFINELPAQSAPLPPNPDDGTEPTSGVSPKCALSAQDTLFPEMATPTAKIDKATLIDHDKEESWKKMVSLRKLSKGGSFSIS